MCSVADMVRQGMPEALAKRCCLLGKRAAALGWGAVAHLVERGIEGIEPLLSAVEQTASAREKRAAALKAALGDVRWKPQRLQELLRQKNASTVSRYLSGETPIPDQVYALPDLGKAFHRREAHLFGFDEEESA